MSANFNNAKFQVAIVRGTSKVTNFRVNSKYKRLVMSTRYKRSPYTAKTVLRQQSLRAATLTEVYRTVQHEIHSICMRKYGDSVLRLLRNASNSSKVCNFSWVELLKEFKTKAPTLMSFVRAALARRGRKVPRYAVGACVSVLLKNRNKNLALVQAVTSIVMYAGHCAKQVNSL